MFKIKQSHNSLSSTNWMRMMKNAKSLAQHWLNIQSCCKLIIMSNTYILMTYWHIDVLVAVKDCEISSYYQDTVSSLSYSLQKKIHCYFYLDYISTCEKWDHLIVL